MGSEEKESGLIDITDPYTFGPLLVACGICGVLYGFACSYLFYITSHICWDGRCVVTEIPTWAGAMFIIILAATGLAVALTFAFVPMWVKGYMERGELPKWLEKTIGMLIDAYLTVFHERYNPRR
jgi:hypothetical protein